jgi:hypothetical protein
MALTKQNLIDQAALELEIAKEIEDSNTKPTVQMDIPLYHAMKSAKYRSAALSRLADDLPGGTPTPTPAPTESYTIALIGSSSTYRFTTEGLGTPNNNVLVSTDGLTYTPMTAGRMCMDAGNLILAETGYAVRWLSCGINGTTLSQWEADGSAERAAAVATINAAIGCNAALIQVGYNEFAFGGAITYEGFKRKWRSLIAKLRAETNQPGLLIFIGMSQDASDYPAAVQMAREVEMAVANNDVNVVLGYQTYDLATYDGIHQTEPSQAITATRFAPQFVSVVKNRAQYRGPFISSAKAVNDNTTDVIISHRKGTDFTAAASIPGFVLISQSGNRMDATGTKLSATSIRLSHASRIGASWQVAYAPDAGAADDAGIIKDNATPNLPLEISERTFIVGDFPVLSDMQAKVAFRSGATSDPTPADWNRLAGGDHTTNMTMALVNPAGQALGWSIFVDAITSTSNQGSVTGNDSGKYPDSVIMQYHYNGMDPAGGPTIPITAVVWRGLNPASTYYIEALGNRASSPRDSIFTIDAIAKPLDAAFNTSRFVSFAGVRPKSDGTITMTYQPKADQFYAYINGAVCRKE